MNKDRLTAFLEEMIDTLTFRRVALLFVLTSIMIVMFTVFENRDILFAKFYRTADTEEVVTWDVSNESKTALVALTNNQLIGASLVTQVNLKQNKRTIKFFYIRDQTLLNEVKPIAAQLLPQAVFDYDPKNTMQMVAMLNNEFLCVPTKDTIFVRYFPMFEQKLPYMCRLAVPPFFGEFAGFVTIGLTREPKPIEVGGLKIEMNRIAIEMYVRDIARRGGATETPPK